MAAVQRAWSVLGVTGCGEGGGGGGGGGGGCCETTDCSSILSVPRFCGSRCGTKRGVKPHATEHSRIWP